MVKLFKFTLLAVLLLSVSVWALPETLVIQKNAPLAIEPLFGREDYQIGELNRGTRAEIISLSTQHQAGVALQVRITNGPNQGQVGWVYLSQDRKKRNMTLLNGRKRAVDLPHLPTEMRAEDDDQVLKNLGTSEQVQIPANSFKEAFTPLIRSMSQEVKEGIFSKEPELVTVKSDKEIWEDFTSGKLILDQDPYKGGKLLSFTTPDKSKKYSATFRPEYLINLPLDVQQTLRSDPECSEYFKDLKVTEEDRYNWHPGCEVLKTPITAQSKVMLTQCLDSIKEVLRNGKKLKASDRSKVFPMFYEKLNPIEQEFLAHMVTSIGEAGVLAPPVEEMVAIMMVLDNRKEYARQKGFLNANALDAALQPSQFSMYNRGAHHWSDALNRSTEDRQTQHALDAFITFKNTHFSDTQKRIFHYHTNAVRPPWKAANKLVLLNINGVELKKTGKRHIFYRDIGWSFGHNSWSKK